MNRDEIFAALKGHLQDIFEAPEADIELESRLVEDLDLDSIDAIDLMVKLQELTGRKIPPDEFKTVKTVGDIVERIHALLNT